MVGGGCFALLALARVRTLTSDSFMTLVGGRWIAQHGLPHVDHLTVAGTGRRWIDEQWLAQWTMYELWNAGGYALLATVAAALVASAFAVLAFTLVRRGSHPRRAVKWTVLALAVTLPDVSIRAQDFAYPLFALLAWLLLRELTVTTATAAIALLALWANLHGSVLVGSLLVAAACARRVKFLPWAAAALAAPLATPYGFSVVHYYGSVLGNSALQRFASEWKPAFEDPLAAVGFFGLVVVVAYVLVTGRRDHVRAPMPLLLVTVALVVAGFAELRWETWAAFPAVVLATDVLNAYDPGGAKPRRRGVVEAAIALAAVVGVVVLATERVSRFEATPPRGAIDAAAGYANTHPSARILADDTSSDALLWTHPELAGRVGFDDRLEVYAPSGVDAWADWIEGKRPPLPGYRVFVASSRNDALVGKLRKLTPLYAGKDGVAARR
jgi:hypothetical protein